MTAREVAVARIDLCQQGAFLRTSISVAMAFGGIGGLREGYVPGSVRYDVLKRANAPL